MKMKMGIVKVKISFPELRQTIAEFQAQRIKAFEVITTEIRVAAANAITQLINSEMDIFLGKPDQVDNKRNGYETKEYALKGVGCIRVKIPVDRKYRFKSAVIPKNEQIDPRLKEDIAVLHLAGISTRVLEMISQRFLGVEISKQTVSNSLESIKEKATNWLTRELNVKYWALYIDGTNFKIQRRGSIEKEPSLVVLGVDENNRKSILAIEPGAKDNAESWRAVFRELIQRGLDARAVRIGIMDGLPGLEAVFKEFFPNSVTARCWVHALKNTLAKTPARLQEGLKQLAHRVMYAESENAAREAFTALKEAMGTDAERAVRCLEKDLDSLLVHYRFDRSLWIALKTTNPIERINKELKRRFKSMGSIGEQTLECLLAFTALRLEMNWQNAPINSIEKRLENFKYVGKKVNSVAGAIDTLLH